MLVAVADTQSPPAVEARRDPAMVRAGAVGTHLPTSSLDIFGDLRKMNKRQVAEIGAVGGAAGDSGEVGVGLAPRNWRRPHPGSLSGSRAAQTPVWHVCARVPAPGERPATRA